MNPEHTHRPLQLGVSVVFQSYFLFFFFFHFLLLKIRPELINHFVMNQFFFFFLSNAVEEAPVVADSAPSVNHQATQNNDVPTKGSGKKQKNVTDKGKTEKSKSNILHGSSYCRVIGFTKIKLSFFFLFVCFDREHRGEAEGTAVWSVQPGSV